MDFDKPPDENSGRHYTAQGIAKRIGCSSAAVRQARLDGRITATIEADSGDRIIHVFESSEMHRFRLGRERFQAAEQARHDAFGRR